MMSIWHEVGPDPLSPPSPVAPYFDSGLEAWILSRYADVLSAFREPRLWPVSPQSEYRPESYDETAQIQIRAETLVALSPAKMAKWREEIEFQTLNIFHQIPPDRSVDLVREFARPWSLALATLITETDPVRAGSLAELAQHVSASAANPYDSLLKAKAKSANVELERNFQKGAMPMGAPAFVALSQTLPALLLNAWLMLLRQPEGFAQLHARPDLVPRAVEELLRCTCLPRTLFRRATADLEWGDVRISEGDRIILMLASANHDPAQFPNPNRIDFTRHTVGHFSLGAGAHACVGAMFIRMALTIATDAFVKSFVGGKVNEPVEWSGGLGFYSPASLKVRLQREASNSL